MRVFLVIVFGLLVLLGAHCSQDGGKNPYGPWIHRFPPLPLPPSCDDPQRPNGFNSGTGSSSNPYVICTYAQFNLIRNGMDRRYILGQDIDASPSWSEHHSGGSCNAYDGSSVAGSNPCDGFEGLPRRLKTVDWTAGVM